MRKQGADLISNDGGRDALSRAAVQRYPGFEPVGKDDRSSDVVSRAAGRLLPCKIFARSLVIDVYVIDVEIDFVPLHLADPMHLGIVGDRPGEILALDVLIVATAEANVVAAHVEALGV